MFSGQTSILTTARGVSEYGLMKTIRLLIAAFLLLPQLTQAAGHWGLGAMVGQPTGVTAKKILANGQAFDAGLGWSLGGNSTFQLHTDWLFNKQEALYWNDQDPLDVYAGIGARMKFGNEIEFGARLPVGAAYYLNERSLELFVELAPIFDLLPERDWELHMLAGFRYYL